MRLPAINRHLLARTLSVAGVRFTLCIAVATACASQSPEVAAPVAVGPAGGQDQAQAATEAQPVAQEPKDLVVVGRVRSPEAFVDTLGEWAGFPIPWREMMGRYPQLQTVLRMDAPVDVAVALEPETKRMPEIYAVFSAGVTDYSAGVNALAASGEPSASDSAGNQVVRLEGDLECAVARANGPTSARLVCGRGLEHIAAFAATNLAQQTIGNNDIYAEVRLIPLQQRYGKQAQMLKMAVPMLLREASLQHPRFDSALAATAHATVADALVLIDELDKFTLSVDLQSDSASALASMQLWYRGSQSFLSGLAVHNANNVGAAPDLFWSLPVGSSNASFTVKGPAYGRMPPVADTLGELFAGAMEHFGLATGQVDAWTSDFKALMNSAGASVHAHIGHAGPAPAPTLAEAVGYDVLGVEGEGGAWARWIESSVRLLNDQRLRTELGERLDEDLKQLPKVTVKTPPGSAGLPPKARHYVLPLPAEILEGLSERFLGSDATVKNASMSLAVAQYGERTWIGWGLDEQQVFAMIKQVAQASATEGIAANPAMARWQSASVNAGSSLQLKELFTPSLFGDDWLSPQEAANVTRAMPNGGQEYLHVETVHYTSGPRAEVRGMLPKAAIADLAAALLSLATAP